MEPNVLPSLGSVAKTGNGTISVRRAPQSVPAERAAAGHRAHKASRSRERLIAPR